MQLGVQRIGPARPAAIEVPPKGEGWHDHYALVHDPVRGGVIYVQEPDHHEFGPMWQLGEHGWQSISTARIRVESPKQPYTAFFDPTAGTIVAWNFSGGRRNTPIGVALGPDGPKLIETTGDLPDAPHAGTFDVIAAFAFDPRRRVTICATTRGIWELGPDRVWRRVWGRGVGEKWGETGVCAAYDAPRHRVVFQMEVKRKALRLYGWSGTAFEEITRAGLPEEYEVTFSDLSPVLGAHPELGAILHLGGDLGRYALSYHGKRWRRLAPLDTPPPRGGNFQLAFDPDEDGFVIGPGKFEPEPDEYPTDQQLFFVEGPLGWTRHGRVEKKSPLDSLWSQKRFLSVGGRWIATGSRTLQTFGWSPEGWIERIEKDRGEALWKEVAGGSNVEVVAAGDRIIAVTMQGGVLELDTAAWTWKTLHAGAGELGANRIDACVAWDPERRRIVVWGGTAGDRWSNRVYFYEAEQWRPARRPSPRPRELRSESSPDYVLVYDTRIGRVVRFGEQHVGVLIDEQWVEVVPAGYAPVEDEKADEDVAGALDGLEIGDDDEPDDDDDEPDDDDGDDDGGDDDDDDDDDDDGGAGDDDEDDDSGDGDDDDDGEGDDDDGAIRSEPAYPGSPRWSAYAHDPTTGITLIVSWSDRVVFRVDLERCENVGTFDLPGDLITASHEKGASMFRDTWTFDATSRELRVQNLEDLHGHYAIALGPLFDRCAAERQAPWEVKLAAPVAWLCLYRPSDRQRWRGRVDGTRVEVGEGPLESNEIKTSAHPDAASAEAAFAESLVAARSAGFVPVAELDRAAITRMLTSGTRPLRIARKPAAGAPPAARLGGRPSGIGADPWPGADPQLLDAVIYHLPEIYPWSAAPAEVRAETLAGIAGEMGVEYEPAPMGFLFQVPTGSLLSKHAGVAVFCALGGRATEHNAYNDARLLATLDGPGVDAPVGVEPLPVFAIEVGPEDRELDKNLLEGLGRVDPGLVDRVEEVWGTDDDEDDEDDDEDEDEDDDDDDDEDDESWHGKLGGDPGWIQSPHEFQSRDGRPYRFLLQLDIDDVSDRIEPWDDAGLSGRLYIFVHPDEACAAVIWQYT
jgi:hypothetical protein